MEGFGAKTKVILRRFKEIVKTAPIKLNIQEQKKGFTIEKVCKLIRMFHVKHSACIFTKKGENTPKHKN